MLSLLQSIVHAPTQSCYCTMQCLSSFASNTLCDRTVIILPVLFEVTTAMCNLVGEKRMEGCERKREGGSVEAGVKTTSLTKPHTSAAPQRTKLD